MQEHPNVIIENGKMHRLQWIAVIITIGLNALDGFDVLSSAFAAPGIAKEWHVTRDALGVVLSMELLGMGFGSVLLGGLADKWGRRPTILACLATMTLGMYLATTAHSPTELSLWRFLTGIGIGGMLATINAVAAELSNLKHRSMAMAIMVIGYPLGAVIGGKVVQSLLKGSDWRVVFEFGAIMTALFIPLVFFLIPETPSFLAQRRPTNALEKINATLKRYGHTLLDALPTATTEARNARLTDIFKPGLIGATIMLTAGYAFHTISFYFVLKWAPKIIADMGHTQSEAAGVLVWANVGGAIGGALFGVMMHRFGIKRPTIVMLALSVVFVSFFGFHDKSTPLSSWAWAAALDGFFTNAAIVGFYSAFAAGFPTHVRATGTGFAVGLGRAGAALSPILAGQLFKANLSLPHVAIVMALGSLFSLLCLLGLKLNDTRTAT
jgi:benzoate transport